MCPSTRRSGRGTFENTERSLTRAAGKRASACTSLNKATKNRSTFLRACPGTSPSGDLRLNGTIVMDKRTVPQVVAPPRQARRKHSDFGVVLFSSIDATGTSVDSRPSPIAVSDSAALRGGGCDGCCRDAFLLGRNPATQNQPARRATQAFPS